MRRKARKKPKQIPKKPEDLIAKFINMIMLDGKKTKAYNVVYGALEEASKKLKKDPYEVFTKAMENVKPILEVRARRVGGATYQIPIEVPRHRAISLAFRWIREAARSKKGKPMKDKLASELIAAYNNEGAADRKSTRLNSSHTDISRMPSSA